jgi:UDP-GlcNAc:undecaprenyl-phosphate GlcNAc-1-phosphate transferase
MGEHMIHTPAADPAWGTVLLFFAGTVVISLVINMLFLRFVKTLGIRNNSDGTVIRWGTLSKPSVGGFSFYIIFLLSIISYSILFDVNQVFLNREFIGVLLATLLGFMLGLTDDAYNTRPLLKFLTQVGCGFILLYTGNKISFSYVEPINIFVTVFWVVGIMNSLNMLDNMDAITGIVSISIILSALGIIVLREEENTVFFILLLGTLGSLIGFLYYNWHPSKIYMGDTGSQFLGVLLAAIGIRYFWNADMPTGEMISARNLMLPMLAFLMPIVDTTCVVINRISRGQSPFVGGKDHTTHALAYRGFSDNKVALVFGAIALVSFVGVVLIEKYITEWSHLHTVVFGLYFLGFLAYFFRATRRAEAHTR